MLVLKLVWLVFAENVSLWAFWVRANLIRDKNFWEADYRRHGSWLWKSICKLRDTARPFIVCDWIRDNSKFLA